MEEMEMNDSKIDELLEDTAEAELSDQYIEEAQALILTAYQKYQKAAKMWQTETSIEEFLNAVRELIENKQ